MSDTNNWSVDAYIVAEAKPNMGLGYQEPEEGAYAIRCTATALTDGKTDPTMKQIVLDLTITEGTAKGMVIKRWLSVPNQNMDADRAEMFSSFIKTALVGLGHDAGKVGGVGGKVPLASAAFLNKSGFIYYTPRNPDARKGEKGSFSDIRFIDAETFKKVKSGDIAVKAKSPEQRRDSTGRLGGTAASASTPAAASFDAGSFAAPPAVAAPTNGAGGDFGDFLTS